MSTKRQGDKSTKLLKPTDPHQHDLPQYDTDDGPVLGCCELCGMTALEYCQDTTEREEDASDRWQQAREALAGLVLKDDRPLFHWSPTSGTGSDLVGSRPHR
jgi:hypothetical protein